MGAISTTMIAPVSQGDRVVAASALFGSCRVICQTILPRYGVETEFVQGSDLDAWKKALSRPAKLVLIESPSNPLLEAVDIAAVAELAHKAGAKLVVDNVFATPILQRPLELGADVFAHVDVGDIDRDDFKRRVRIDDLVILRAFFVRAGDGRRKRLGRRHFPAVGH